MIGLIHPALAASPALDAGSGAGLPGATAGLSVSITRNGKAVYSTQNDLQFDNTRFSITPSSACTLNTAIAPSPLRLVSGKVCSVGGGNCTSDTDCTGGNQPPCNILRLGVLSSGNATPITGDGALVTCTFSIQAAAPPGLYAVTNPNPQSFDSNGDPFAGTSGTDGSLTVLGATYTPSPTSTPTLAPTPPPTSTSTQTATNTPTQTRTRTMTRTPTNTPIPPLLDLNSVNAVAGGAAGVTVTLTRNSNPVAGTSNDIGFDSTVLSIDPSTDCSINTTTAPGFNLAAAKVCSNATGTCSTDDDCINSGNTPPCNIARVGVYKIPPAVIPHDGVMITCTFTVSPDAAGGIYPLSNTNLQASDTLGNLIAGVSGSAGSVVLASPTATNTSVSAPTATPSNSPSSSPTSTPTFTPSSTATQTATRTPTSTPSGTPANTATNSPTSTPTLTPTQTATRTPTNSPTNSATSTATFTPTPSRTPTNTPSGTPTNTPTNSPTGTATPTQTATLTPTNSPTNSPTSTPTFTQTATRTPTSTPSGTPTSTSTGSPTGTPPATQTATLTPTNSPTNSPTRTPTFTATPTLPPTSAPSGTPTNSPSNTPTRTPTLTPTNSPTSSPTGTPTFTPTPTRTPTSAPTSTATTTPQVTPTPSATPEATIAATPTPTPTALLSGAIHYYSNNAPVAGVTVRLAGSATATAQTDANGQFAFFGLAPGDYSMVPSKQADQGAGISTLDAVYILEAIGGQLTLDSHQLLAADVTGNGTISPLDASRILQIKAGAINRFDAAATCNSDWIFVPVPSPVANQSVTMPHMSTTVCGAGSISYAPLASPAAHQDFQAILFGDCTGNWTPPTP